MFYFIALVVFVSALLSLAWAVLSKERALAEDQARVMKMALDQGASMIVIFDGQGRPEYVNNLYTSKTGFGIDDLRSVPQGMLLLCKEDEAACEFVLPKLQAGEIWSSEFVHKKKDGPGFWVRANVLPIERGVRVKHIVAVLEDITRQKLKEVELRQQAYFDQLTGLASRSLFHERLGQAVREARRYGERMAVLYIDLDKFKPVNDTYGHEAGDEVLRNISGRLLDAVRESDTVARLGGDEFAIILVRIEAPEDAVKVGEKIVGIVSKPVDVGLAEVTVGASVGVVVFPDDGSAEDELLEKADAAMYASKKGGRGRVTRTPEL